MDKYLVDTFWQSNEVEILRNPLRGGDDEGLGEFIAASEELRAHVLFSTSGSSGEAKWVALSKSALLNSARAVSDYFRIKESDVLAVVLPLFHVGGFGLLVRSYVSGAKVVEWEKKWNASAVVQWLSENEVSITSMVPAQVLDLCKAGLRAPLSLRAVVVGGGHLSDELLAEARSLGWPVYLSYGQTEAASQLATGQERWLDVLNGVEVRLDKLGCLEWKSSFAFSGYVKRVSGVWKYETNIKDSWVTTQDRVELRGSQLRFIGRADRVVKILGELVDIHRLEVELSEEVNREVKVITVEHERRGWLLVPVVEGLPAEFEDRKGVERMERCQTVTAFPRSELGKVLLNDLRALLQTHVERDFWLS